MKTARTSITASVAAPRASACPVTSSPSADMTSLRGNGGAAVDAGSCTRRRRGVEGRGSVRWRYQVVTVRLGVVGACVARGSKPVAPVTRLAPESRSRRVVPTSTVTTRSQTVTVTHRAAVSATYAWRTMAQELCASSDQSAATVARRPTAQAPFPAATAAQTTAVSVFPVSTRSVPTRRAYDVVWAPTAA